MKHIPDATVARLPGYLRVLVGLEEVGTATVSSVDLAAAAGVNSSKLRKDLSHLGSFGTRGVGYPVPELVREVSTILGLTTDRNLALVGVGNLGRALAAYGGFAERGFHLVALLDASPGVVGDEVAGSSVEDVAELERVVADRSVSIAVLATPAAVAQEMADRLAAAGVTAILNFAPAHVEVASPAEVRRVDLSAELQILSFHAQLHA